MDPLAMAPPACSLGETGLRTQYERYRQAGVGARVVEHGALRLVVELDADVEAKLVEEAIAVERKCCPFYEFGWEPDRRRLTVSVSGPEDAPALEAITFALGLEAPAPYAAD